MKKRSQWEILHELLGLFHDNKLSADQFWAQMRQHDLTDEDIDKYCHGIPLEKSRKVR